MSVNLTIFFIYLQKYVIKNTQFSKQNRRKQIWARMKYKRCKIIEKNYIVVSGDNFSEFIEKFCFLKIKEMKICKLSMYFIFQMSTSIIFDAAVVPVSVK